MQRALVFLPPSDVLIVKLMATVRTDELVYEDQIATLMSPHARQEVCIVQTLMVAAQCIAAGDPECAALLFARIPRYIRALVSDHEAAQRALDLFARRMATYYADDRLIA